MKVIHSLFILHVADGGQSPVKRNIKKKVSPASLLATLAEKG